MWLQGWLAVQNTKRGAFRLFFLLQVVCKEKLFHEIKLLWNSRLTMKRFITRILPQAFRFFFPFFFSGVGGTAVAFQQHENKMHGTVEVLFAYQ
jgi:hypothetical protein